MMRALCCFLANVNAGCQPWLGEQATAARCMRSKIDDENLVPSNLNNERASAQTHESLGLFQRFYRSKQP